MEIKDFIDKEIDVVLFNTTRTCKGIIHIFVEHDIMGEKAESITEIKSNSYKQFENDEWNRVFKIVKVSNNRRNCYECWTTNRSVGDGKQWLILLMIKKQGV